MNSFRRDFPDTLHKSNSTRSRSNNTRIPVQFQQFSGGPNELGARGKTGIHKQNRICIIRRKFSALCRATVKATAPGLSLKSPPGSRGSGWCGWQWCGWGRRSHFLVCCWRMHQRGFSCADSLTHRAISSLILTIPFIASVSIRSCSSRRP